VVVSCPTESTITKVEDELKTMYAEGAVSVTNLAAVGIAAFDAQGASRYDVTIAEEVSTAFPHPPESRWRLRFDASRAATQSVLHGPWARVLQTEIQSHGGDGSCFGLGRAYPTFWSSFTQPEDGGGCDTKRCESRSVEQSRLLGRALMGSGAGS
jgi:hypothetical protein